MIHAKVSRQAIRLAVIPSSLESVWLAISRPSWVRGWVEREAEVCCMLHFNRCRQTCALSCDAADCMLLLLAWCNNAVGGFATVHSAYEGACSTVAGLLGDVLPN
jgi:hypothetical protein